MPSRRLSSLAIGVLLVRWVMIVVNSAGIQPLWLATALALFSKGVAGGYIAHGLGVDVLLRRWTVLAQPMAYLRSTLFEWQVAALCVLMASAAYVALITISANAPDQARRALFTTIVYTLLLATLHLVTAIRLWRNNSAAGQTQPVQRLVTPPALAARQNTRQQLWKTFLLWAAVFLLCLVVVYFRGSS